MTETKVHKHEKIGDDPMDLVPRFVTSANAISQKTFCQLRHVSVELLSVFVSACTALFKLVVHL